MAVLCKKENSNAMQVHVKVCGTKSVEIEHLEINIDIFNNFHIIASLFESRVIIR